jgi:hypothetical protein
MLLVYLEPLELTQQELLVRWRVDYWPRSYTMQLPMDYWLLFHKQNYVDMWLLMYPDLSRIIIAD